MASKMASIDWQYSIKNIQVVENKNLYQRYVFSNISYYTYIVVFLQSYTDSLTFRKV